MSRITNDAEDNLYNDLLTVAWHFNSQCSSDLDFEGLTLSDFLTLRLIAEAPECPVQSIGQNLGLTKSGASRVVKRLQTKGLVTSACCPQDGRARRLCLTEQGTKFVENFTEGQSKWINRLVQSMPSQTAEQVHESLRLFAKFINSEKQRTAAETSN
ncbi:MarR family transcriptional regulator [Rhodobacteraceae bacterium RKSG542]|uniref:MarR family winged helix-turn-helix transcriptional regulator n=1 Tax=Pseudovibrio flavus TaxID=2529854 RepID=UPI0012BC2ACA|nr:MarR family transcriptional regulator [Pseudovibrio flavus]MTI15750.1 MarR family transcriptional regulator [Pseudovibrio flavus]